MAEIKSSFSFYSMKELNDFLKESKEIMVYGAGNYAHRLIEYLKKKGQPIKAVCVSDGEKIREQEIANVPVMHISELRMKSHIILAVNSKHHQAILSAIDIKSPGSKVLILHDLFFDFTLKFLLFLTSEEKDEFMSKARHIAGEYQYVEFCFGTTMQCFGLMMFFVIRQELEKNEPDVLKVYIPDFFNLHSKLDLCQENPGNPYFYGKLKERFCFLDSQNASFWRFFLEHFPEKTKFSDGYMWKGMENFQLSHWQGGRLMHEQKYFSLDDKEIKAGELSREAMGIKPPYVCFNARSDRYFSAKGINNARTQAQSDQRNSSVEKFSMMCEILGQRGLQSVRMGAMSEGEINGENIVDYSVMPRDPFMDYYLISECEFVVCQYSGFHHIAILFNKPTIITDAINLTIKGDIADTVNPQQDIMLLKKIYSPELKRCLTFREMLEFEVKYPDLYERTTYYAQNNYQFIENTDREVAEAALEMLDRLAGRKRYDQEYVAIQEKVSRMREGAAAVSGSCYWDVPLAEYYIRNNLWLLE